MIDLTQTLDRPAPPEDLPPALAALWWLRKGEFEMGAAWDHAHGIAQEHEGEALFDAIHALAHRIEGDEFNAGYWYRRAGSAPAASFEAEWQALIARAEG
ncbi:hypothetical protein ACW9UR_21750 [Halovulum sp. GXIMD14794]